MSKVAVIEKSSKYDFLVDVENFLSQGYIILNINYAKSEGMYSVMIVYAERKDVKKQREEKFNV